MQQIRLLADDLTGALDTAAELVGVFGPLDVIWDAAAPLPGAGSLAIDSGTREATPAQAFEIVQRLAPLLQGGIAYKKVDSLLRGPWTAELDACLQTGLWDACIVAPAFPYQGRRTQAGQQYARDTDGGWRAAGDVVAQLRAQNIEARLGRIETELQPGVSVFDAETEADLDRIAHLGRRYAGRLLWCGNGGLAGALARGAELRASRKLNTPVLGVFGSDHPATGAQLAVCTDIVVPYGGGEHAAAEIARRLDDGVAFVTLQAPPGGTRLDAARRFEQQIAQLSRAVDRPGTLIAAGGETLKAQCLAVGANTLKVLGRIEPGLPRSMIQGGLWAGVDVISKSGAFGPPELWRNLLRDNKLV